MAYYLGMFFKHLLDPILIGVAVGLFFYGKGKSVKKGYSAAFIAALILAIVSGLLAYSNKQVASMLTFLAFMALYTVFSVIHRLVWSSESEANSTQENDRTNSIVDLASNSLEVQRSLITDEYGILPEKAKSNWSLGYVGGFSDAVLQQANVPLDGGAFAMMTLIFINIFGETEGPVLFRKFMDLQDAHDDDLFNGMEIGGSEFMEWISNRENVPTSWARKMHE